MLLARRVDSTGATPRRPRSRAQPPTPSRCCGGPRRLMNPTGDSSLLPDQFTCRLLSRTLGFPGPWLARQRRARRISFSVPHSTDPVLATDDESAGHRPFRPHRIPRSRRITVIRRVLGFDNHFPIAQVLPHLPEQRHEVDTWDWPDKSSGIAPCAPSGTWRATINRTTRCRIHGWLSRVAR